MENKFALCGNLGFAPQIQAILNSVDPEICVHRHYSLRHPADIFHSAFSDLVQGFLALVEVIGPLEQKAESEEPELSDASVKLFKELLAGFSRYMDCGYEVLVTLAEKQAVPSQNEFKWKWLQKHGYKAGKLYFTIFKSEVDLFTSLNNQLKHSSDSLKPVTVFINSRPCLGYFLEGADSNGVLGPSTIFHKGPAGTRSANSFNRDLRILHRCIYSVADALRRAVELHIKSVHKRDCTENADSQYDDKSCKELFDRLSELPKDFYSSEGGKPVPFATFEVQATRKVLIFESIKAPMLYGTFRTTSGGTIGRSGMQVPLP